MCAVPFAYSSPPAGRWRLALHAARCASHIVALHRGRVVAQGAPADVIIQDVVQTVFGVESYIMPHPLTGQPMCLPVKLNCAPKAE